VLVSSELEKQSSITNLVRHLYMGISARGRWHGGEKRRDENLDKALIAQDTRVVDNHVNTTPFVDGSLYDLFPLFNAVVVWDGLRRERSHVLRTRLLVCMAASNGVWFVVRQFLCYLASSFADLLHHLRGSEHVATTRVHPVTHQVRSAVGRTPFPSHAAAQVIHHHPARNTETKQTTPRDRTWRRGQRRPWRTPGPVRCRPLAATSADDQALGPSHQ
jgi:hypothetical protein